MSDEQIPNLWTHLLEPFLYSVAEPVDDLLLEGEKIIEERHA